MEFYLLFKIGIEATVKTQSWRIRLYEDLTTSYKLSSLSSRWHLYRSILDLLINALLLKVDGVKDDQQANYKTFCPYNTETIPRLKVAWFGFGKSFMVL